MYAMVFLAYIDISFRTPPGQVEPGQARIQAMPRVAITLLLAMAMVSIMGLHGAISQSVPEGVITFLAISLLGGLLNITYMGSLHCWVFALGNTPLQMSRSWCACPWRW